MENLRQLLALMAATILALSVISGTNFVMHSAFADNGKVTATFGQSSEIELEIDDEMEKGAVVGDLTIETEDGDLADGEYAVSLSCTSPETEQALDGSLKVEGGEGEIKGEVSLADGSTYEGCEVAIGDELSVALPSFTVQVEDDDEEKSNSGRGNSDDDDDRNAGSRGNDGDEDDDERGNSRNATSSRNDDDDDRRESETVREEKRKFKLDVDDGRVEIEVEVEGIAMEDGLYDAVFSCDAPPVNMTFTDGFEVDDGEGEFEKDFALENGTYTGCELAAGGTVVASFGTFTVSEDGNVEQKREERRKTIVSNANATQTHARHVNANPASSGNYTQGSDYILMANGTAEGEQEAGAMINATMSVWKSTRAIILLDILDGTVTVGNKTYDIAIGYALYSTNHDAMRIVALVADDSGEVLKLKLRGEADGDQAEFPKGSGDSLDVSFEGNSGPGRNNNLGGWELELEGTIQAS